MNIVKTFSGNIVAIVIYPNWNCKRCLIIALLIVTQLYLFEVFQGGRQLASWVHGRQQYVVNLGSSLCVYFLHMNI